jgi:hypothetical protein
MRLIRAISALAGFCQSALATGISIFLCMIIISVNHTNMLRFSDEMPRY